MAGLEVTNRKVVNQALRFELGKPVDLDEWALARKRLYDTNVFRLVDIQPVPIGDPVNGVQQVKAVVTVEEYPAWSVRYGFQFEGERQAALDEFTNTRNAGVVAEVRNPNLFGRALTGGVFGMYQRDRRDASVLVATSRLFGWRARSTLYGFYSRDRFRNPDTSAIESITDQQGVSADQRWRTRGFQIVYGYRFERNHTHHPGCRQRSVAVRYCRQPRQAEQRRCYWIAATTRSARARARSARSRSTTPRCSSGPTSRTASC